MVFESLGLCCYSPQLHTESTDLSYYTTTVPNIMPRDNPAGNLTIMPRENPAGNLPFKLRIDIRPYGW